MAAPRDLAAEIRENKRQSLAWMEDNFYAQWEQVFLAYQCERKPRTDPNTGNVDGSRTSLAAPDTFATINRNVARLTAQLPNIRFRADDEELAEMISRTLMYQWDISDVQLTQKRHVRQAGIFGWSVRPWAWECRRQWRTKRVNPFDPSMPPEGIAALLDFYRDTIQQMGLEGQPPQVILGQLIGKFGKGSITPLLPVRYQYTAYEGPSTDFLFVGDCYPQPQFQGIQKSSWFIVERRRKREWMIDTARAFPAFAPVLEELLRANPKGTPYRQAGTTTANLRSRLSSMEANGVTAYHGKESGEWTITEMHKPGANPTLAIVGDGGDLAGEIPYPYDLDGNIAFTECILIDNLLHGVGDSAVRMLRGIQELHSNLLGLRSDLWDDGLRPLIGTSDPDLYENPERIKKFEGFRLAYLPNGPNSVWTQDTSQMLQAAGASASEEAALMRLWQTGTGDNNMSMGANVDPQQTRTATGARLMTLNLDTLTRDQIDMFTVTSLREDAEMMYRLNRSELADAVEFDGGAYRRNYGDGPDRIKSAWIKAEPLMFQTDGRVLVESGSTLADDDEARVEKAKTLMQALAGNPLVNQRKLLADFLVSMGKGRDLDAWITPEQSGPSEPPPPKTSVSVSTKLEMLPPDAQQTILQGAGLLPPGAPQGLGPEGGATSSPQPGQPQEPAAMPMPQGPPEEMPAGARGVRLPGLPGQPATTVRIPGDEPQP